MNRTKLIKFVDTIISLKAKLKCLICLDIMQDVAELDCGHQYCKDCYLEHKSLQKQTFCPQCKRIFKRRSSIYSDNYASSLGKFVQNCCENIKVAYNCEVEQLQKRLRDRTDELKFTDNVLHENVTKKSNLQDIPSTSNKTKRIIKHRERSGEKCNAKKTNRRKTSNDSAKENYTNAFDKLMNEPLSDFNRKGVKRVYTNKKKPKVQSNILEFNNNENKTAVLRWLHDTRNKFDRLSQTQNIGNEPWEVPVIDLVSVSQIKDPKKESKPITSKHRTSRAKSLDVEVKPVLPFQKKNLKVRSASLENYSIEDNTEEEELVKKAEEKVIQDLIEDEFLEVLDNQMRETENSQFDIKSKRYNRAKKKPKPLSPTSTTGWERLTKIERTIEKNERVPRKLNITLQSTQEQKNDDSLELKVALTPRIFTKKGKNILQKVCKNLKQNTTEDVTIVDNKKPTIQNLIDTNASKGSLVVALIQNDFVGEAENVKRQNQEDELSVVTDKEVVENKSRPPEEHTNKHTEDASETGIENHKQCYDLDKLEDYLTKNIKIIDKSVSADSALTEASQHEKTETDARNCHPEEAKTQFKDDRCVLLDVIFDVPTQKISHADSSKSIVIEDVVKAEPMDQDSPKLENRSKDASLDEIMKLYSNPTQQILHTCSNTSNKQDSTEGLLHLLEEGLEKCIRNLKSADLTVENYLQVMLSHLAKLKTLHKTDNGFTKQEPVVVERCDAQTQTEVEVIDRTAQTERNTSNVEVQMEDFRCLQCNTDLVKNKAPDDLTLIPQDATSAVDETETSIDFKPTLHSTVSSKAKSRSQFQEFTCTLDNLNFDTQEIAKNQGSISKIPQKTSGNPVATQNKTQASPAVISNKTGSVLICSLNSNKSTEPKKINRKLTYEGDKRYKRIKIPTSDSDSDGEELPAKRKCNRFLREDLTVEFLTNPDISDSKEDTKASAVDLPDSDSFNYDEYLSEVMKKYEGSSFSTRSSNSKKSKTLTPKQKLNAACEEMISNAKKIQNPLKTVTELSIASSKDSFTTASDSVCNNFEDDLVADEVFMNEDNMMKLESEIRKYETKAQSFEMSDIIGETEHVEPLPKKRKMAVLENVPSSRDLSIGQDILSERENLDKKIKILANVKIKSQDRKEVAEVDDDDLFADDDIVETTPQKKTGSFAEKLAHSRIMSAIDLIDNTLPPPEEIEGNFDFDSAPLPPPPDFQDDLDIPPTPERLDEDDDPTKDDTTVINLSSLTPDDLSQFIFRNPKAKERKNVSHNENLSLTPDILTQRNVRVKQETLSRSTPVVKVDITTQSLGLSPITTRKSQKMGMAEMTQAAKYTPLNTITKQTPQKLNLFTSTPRQKSIWNYVRLSQSSDDAGPSLEKAKPCIACTRLSKDQMRLVHRLTEKKLVTLNSHFDRNVTHMIVMPNENNCIKEYTIKCVSAIAAGIWVLRFEWVEECLARNCIVPEEPFEVLDISGCPGPKTSRLTRARSPLFEGCKFFCAGPFMSTTKGEVENIIKMVGGRLVPDMEGFLVRDGDIGFIVAEVHATQDFEQFERWAEKYKTVTVDIEWLSKCVGQYKILNIRPYLCCSEENLDELDYPSVLTEAVPISDTEPF